MLFLDRKHTNTNLIYENSLINYFKFEKEEDQYIFKKSAEQLISPALIAWTKSMLKFSSALAWLNKIQSGFSLDLVLA